MPDWLGRIAFAPASTRSPRLAGRCRPGALSVSGRR